MINGIHDINDTIVTLKKKTGLIKEEKSIVSQDYFEMQNISADLDILVRFEQSPKRADQPNHIKIMMLWVSVVSLCWSCRFLCVPV